MCVIFIAESRKPTKRELTLAEKANPDGAGIAWVKNGRVIFRKGLNADEIWRLITIEKPEFPFVVHFRMATVGGSTKELTHPFPITENVELLHGDTVDSPVLFHNGHYSNWEDTLIPIRANHDIPKGKWSDSRGLAWLVYHAGVKALDLITSQKFVVLDPIGTAKKWGIGWSTNNGLTASNRYWENTFTYACASGSDWSRDYYGSFSTNRYVKPSVNTVSTKPASPCTVVYKTAKPHRTITAGEHADLMADTVSGLTEEEADWISALPINEKMDALRSLDALDSRQAFTFDDDDDEGMGDTPAGQRTIEEAMELFNSEDVVHNIP